MPVNEEAPPVSATPTIASADVSFNVPVKDNLAHSLGKYSIFTLVGFEAPPDDVTVCVPVYGLNVTFWVSPPDLYH